MDQRPDPPYFDPTIAGAELTALVRAADLNMMAARPALVARLKALIADARKAARARLDIDGDGAFCAVGLSVFTDALIVLVHDLTVRHAHPPTTATPPARMAIVATGGYGRGRLAPRSDIDLLFLLPSKQTPRGESVVEFMLYLLWDLGLKVGHATRTVDQSVRLALDDITIRTALLDSRFILGDRALADELEGRYASDVVKGTTRAFIEAKLDERDHRLDRTGESRYRVEPNVKDGKGGLRDLHTLHWLITYLQRAGGPAGRPARGVFSAAEYHAFRKCEDFLWTVRCHLHFLADRAEERLTFDLQPQMAERLGYATRGGLKGVERFMKHYFLVAKEVGDLTRIVCAALEMRQLKAEPLTERLKATLSWRERAQLRRRTDFRFDNGRITIAHKGGFAVNPANLLRLFQLSEEYDAEFHPEALRLVRQSLRLVDDKLRADPAANSIFLELLTAKSGVERVLRNMNEAGVLGRFIPDFGRVVAMMQFNMYHHFTVDEHLIRSVGILNEIEAGRLEDDHPLATEIIHQVQNRRALYVAQFLHDIGKGRAEDHSIVGARVARALGPRLGLGKAETETVAWLIENHLVMSTYAQSRDLNDPKTIRDFAAIVQSPERLRLLLILTVADIRAVGPGVWNGWKGQLLRTLYAETEPLLAGDVSRLDRKSRSSAAAAELSAALPDWSKAEIDRFVGRHHHAYWVRTDTAKQAEHAKLMRRAETDGARVATDVKTDAFTAITELTVLAPNDRGLLALLAGACAAAEANIVGAHISTTRDGLALDTFLLQRTMSEADEHRRAARIGEAIERLMAGETTLEKLFGRRKRPAHRLSAFDVEPEATINNALSDEHSVVEVAGLDRPGLLHELTSALSELGLDINSAHVATYGEKAIDVFYVTDAKGQKVADENRREAIRARLASVLAGTGEARADLVTNR